MNVSVSVTLLVLLALALAVGAPPVHEDVPVQTTEDTSTMSPYQRISEKWSKLDQEERVSVLDSIEQEVGSAVGPVYIALGTPESPFRSTKDETHLFDAYGLMFPGNSLPHVLLCPATSSNQDDRPPPFESLPLSNVQIRKDNNQLTGEAQPLTNVSAQSPTHTPTQRIPGFVYYKGVPWFVPRTLGKIRIKMSAVNRMIKQRELDQ